MDEIKKKLGLTKITFRNFFLLILVMVVMAVIGLMFKSMKGGLGESNNPPNWLINQASADVPGCFSGEGTPCDSCGPGASEGAAGEGGGSCGCSEG